MKKYVCIVLNTKGIIMTSGVFNTDASAMIWGAVKVSSYDERERSNGPHVFVVQEAEVH